MATVTLTESAGQIVVCPAEIDVAQNWSIEFDGSGLSREFEIKFDKRTLKNKKAKQWYPSSGKKLVGESRSRAGGGYYEVRFLGDANETQARMIIKPPGFAWAIKLIYFVVGAVLSFGATYITLT